MKVTIEIPDHQVDEFGSWMSYKKMCGALHPREVPGDRVLLAVVVEVVKQLKEKADGPEKVL